MDTGTFRGLITLVLIMAFIGIVAWAYSRRRQEDFNEAANLPFADEETPGVETPGVDSPGDNSVDSEQETRP
ncbi:cbb3-type cytochrome oxidase subunit 3 [Vreelandella sp. EE22]